MVLSDKDLQEEIKKGELSFQPSIREDQIAPSAIDLHLGNQFTSFNTILPGITIDTNAMAGGVEDLIDRLGETSNLTEQQSFTICPGDLVLAYTKEAIRLPNYLAARIEGRSSLARLGISIHQTAPTIHATFDGQLRLEISHNGPYKCSLRPGERICQIIIERLSSPANTSLKSSFQQQRQKEI